jgi:hypothetical protein
MMQASDYKHDFTELFLAGKYADAEWHMVIMPFENEVLMLE